MPTPHNLICPECGHRSVYVKDSRSIQDRTVIRRRRECPECEARFTTYEVMATSIDHIVILGEWEIGADEMAKRHKGILG